MKELTLKEQQETNGGILPLLLVAAEVYLVVCGVATVAGAGTAYVQNKLEKK